MPNTEAPVISDLGPGVGGLEQLTVGFLDADVSVADFDLDLLNN